MPESERLCLRRLRAGALAAARAARRRQRAEPDAAPLHAPAAVRRERRPAARQGHADARPVARPGGRREQPQPDHLQPAPRARRRPTRQPLHPDRGAPRLPVHRPGARCLPDDRAACRPWRPRRTRPSAVAGCAWRWAAAPAPAGRRLLGVGVVVARRPAGPARRRPRWPCCPSSRWPPKEPRRAARNRHGRQPDHAPVDRARAGGAIGRIGAALRRCRPGPAARRARARRGLDRRRLAAAPRRPAARHRAPAARRRRQRRLERQLRREVHRRLRRAGPDLRARAAGAGTDACSGRRARGPRSAAPATPTPTSSTWRPPARAAAGAPTACARASRCSTRPSPSTRPTRWPTSGWPKRCAKPCWRRRPPAEVFEPAQRRCSARWRWRPTWPRRCRDRASAATTSTSTGRAPSASSAVRSRSTRWHLRPGHRLPGGSEVFHKTAGSTDMSPG